MPVTHSNLYVFCATDKNKFANPFFICSDNEAKMKAAFDGRFDNLGGFNIDGRVGCVEHALSICITDVFSKKSRSDLINNPV